jgi:hypothetical protein
VEGEITRNDLKTELLDNWDLTVLQEVAGVLEVQIPNELSKEEIVDQLLDRAPLDRLLEQLLRRELSDTGDFGSKPDTGHSHPPAEGADHDSDAVSKVQDAEILSVATAAEAITSVEPPEQVAPLDAPAVSEERALAPSAPGIPLPPGATVENSINSSHDDEESAVLLSAIHDLDVEAKSQVVSQENPAEQSSEQIPREALELELMENWSQEDVRDFCHQFSVAEQGCSKAEAVQALLDEVSVEAVLQEILARDEKERQGSSASEASSPTSFATKKPISEPPPPAPQPEPPPPPPPLKQDSYDEASILKELRSMQRGVEEEDDDLEDEEESAGGGGLMALGLVVAIVGVGWFTPSIRTKILPPAPPPGTPVTSPTSLPSTPVSTEGKIPPMTAPGAEATLVTTLSSGSTPEGEITNPVTPEVTLPPSTVPELIPTSSPMAPSVPVVRPSPTPMVTLPVIVTRIPSVTVTPATSSNITSSTTGAGTAESAGDIEAKQILADLLDEAQISEKNGEFGRAAFMLEKALEQGGEDWSRRSEILERTIHSHFLTGEKAFQDGNTELAQQSMKNTLRYQPTHARAQFFLGRCFERLGQYDDAIAAYKKSLQNDPKNGRTHSYLAYVYRAQKKYQDAQREAQLAQKYGETLDPGFLFLLRYRPTPRSE